MMYEKKIMFFSENLISINSSSNKPKKHILGGHGESKLNQKINMKSK